MFGMDIQHRLADSNATWSRGMTLPDVTAIIAAYNEEDVIEQAVADLIAQGCRVFLIDHCSTDGTVAAVSRHLGRGLLGIERFPDDSCFPSGDRDRFAWRHLLERKEQLARILPGDWFMHVDADELRESPWPHLSLREAVGVVDRLGYNAVDFAVFNFRPLDDRFKPGDDLRASFTHYEPGESFDVTQIKGWKRAEVVLARSGGHSAEVADRKVFPLRFVMRHYPLRSQQHAARKIFSERRPRFVDEERREGWHVQYENVSHGDRFQWDPSRLLEWDGELVRARLAIANRSVEAMGGEVDALRRALAEVRQEAAGTEEQLRQLRSSLTWRLSAPLRRVSRWGKDLILKVI